MRQIYLSLAGALAFAGAAASWDALCERSYEAAAPVSFHSAAPNKSIDIQAARMLLVAEPVLRRAALRPEAAAAIERRTRRGRLESLLSLVAPAASHTDTIGRAVALLAERVDVRAGAWPDMIEIVARMPAAEEAAAVATAMAEAFVADINETWLATRRRDTEQRAMALDRATRRLDEAKERLQALRASDPAPVASLPATSSVAGDKRLDRLKAEAVAAAENLADASRIYGPRHPQLLARQNESRRAQAAFALAASRPSTANAATAIVGGPDPRATEIAAAEDRVAEAQGGYDLETSRREAERREARVLKPAPIPARASGGIGGAGAAIAGVLGFLVFLGAPVLARSVRPRPQVRDRSLGRLRGGAIVDPRRTIALLDIAASETARRILVVAPSRARAEESASAIARALLAEGWRPLLLVDRSGSAHATKKTASIDGKLYSIRTSDTDSGPLDVACLATQETRGVATAEADAVYDAIIGFAAAKDIAGAGRSTIEFDCLVSVARALSDARASRLTQACGGVVNSFAGTILV